jgi:recombination protein RecA
VERDKALDMALGQIEKQFGKGAIMRMGEEAKVRVASIPTGALSLDLALGIGGLPRGRVIEIYGPESSGKCQTAGTYVWSDHGLETVEELFARVGQPASCTSRVTDVRDHGVRLVNEEAKLELMAAVTHNNRKPVWRIELESGRHVEATANHPFRVLNERGRIVWRTVKDLEEGDVMVSALFGAETATGGSDLSEDEAVLLGYLVAEGTLGHANRHKVAFTNAHDDDVLAEYRELMEHVLDVDPVRIQTYGGKEHHVHDTAVRRRLADDYGLAYAGSAAKEIPHCVRTAGAKVQRAFLSALYEGDGWIEKGPEVGYTSASRTLAEQVQLLLFGLGVPCSLRTRHDASLDRDYHTVLVPPGSVARFLEQVGFRSARRAEQVERHLRESRPVTFLEGVPYLADLLRDLRDALGGDRELDRIIRDVTRTDLTSWGDGSIDCSPTRLIRVLKWIESRHVPASAKPLVTQLHELAARPLTYERVTKIEAAGEQPTFDVMVPGTHSFLANGVLSHNTTVALHAIAEAQKAGGIAAFIDAEHALDPNYAAALGVDVEALLVSQPDTGEQALEITDMLVRSGAVDMIVVDSVAALTPRAEIEGEMGDTHVGLQARLMSQALRKLAGTLHKSKTSAIFINQLREKIGVMFGCFSYETHVTLADGTQEKIGKIVNQRMDVEVLSYDAESGRVVPRRVVNWFDNGPTEEFLQFTVARGGGNGRAQFAATANHQIQTPGGWREAQELLPGDRVMQAVPHHLSGFQWEVLLGSLMGDGSLSPSRSGHGARFRYGHGEAQVAYAEWKASLFANINCSRSTNDEGAVFYDLQPLPELAELREAVHVGDRKVLSYDYLKRLTPLSLALWYMDDGGFQIRAKGVQERTKDGSGRAEICISAFDEGSQGRLVDYLRDEWGLEPSLVHKAGQATLVFGKEATARLHELVAPYVHPSMDYKLLPRFRGQFDVEPVFEPMRRELAPMPVLSIERRPPRGRVTHRFDIEVEGTHNYFVDGVMVHNSPETTPGGRALKFYSSVRLDVRRIESLKDGTDVVGNRVRVKVVKNKVAPPFKQAEFDIMYGEGISKEGSILDIGVDEGIVKKAGAWYTYEGEQLGQGRENAKTFLKEHTEIAEEIYKRVTEQLGLVPTDVTGDEAAGDDDSAE